MATQPRNTLHNFIMREAASTGQLKERPARLTKAQREALELMKGGAVRADIGLLEVHHRTWCSILDRGLATIERLGGGLRWAGLTDAGRLALTASEEKGS